MSRFVPDSLLEAVLRPVAMASPDAGVYVEFIAPDFRFVLLALLLAATVVLRRRATGPRGPVFALALFCVVAFVPWLATTGNGRYFLPVLVVVGPLCVALVARLPGTRSLRLTVALGLLGGQAWLLAEVSPWGVWNFTAWRDGPALRIEVPADMRERPATYVSVSDLSHSLVAIRFHPQSRWINVASQLGTGRVNDSGRRAAAFIAQGDPIRVIFPSPFAPGPSPVLPAELAEAIDHLLARLTLSIRDPAACRFLPSKTLGEVSEQTAKRTGQDAGELGFWVCELAREALPAARRTLPVPPRADAVFDKLERLCPRLFRRGEAATLAIAAGALRGYTGADTRVYVLHDGTVSFKYLRSLNPEVIGRVDEVLRDDFRFDCGRVHRRTVLPWLRGI